MENLINLMPHPCNVLTNEETGLIVSIKASGTIARVATEVVAGGTVGELFNGCTTHQVVDGIKTFKTTVGDVVDLPAQVGGVVLIVSAMVRTHPSVCNRLDLVSPTGLIRDSEGMVMGCKGFNTNH